MNVLAHLPSLQLAHLRGVLGDRGPHRVHAARGWAEVEALLRLEAIDVAVFDPAVGGAVEPAAVSAITRRFRSLPVVIYTTLTPGSLKGILALAREGLTELVLNRFDDDPGRFRELLERLASNGLAEALIGRLRPRLSLLPLTLAGAVEECFRDPGSYGVAEDLARRGSASRRTLYRALDAAGLGSPSHIVKGARLLRAYGYLRDNGYSLEDVSRKCGFGSRQLFARQVRLLSGMQPREMRRRVTPEEFVTMLASFVTEPAAGQPGQDGGPA
jgi:AraC-like DNA-binding protein